MRKAVSILGCVDMSNLGDVFLLKSTLSLLGQVIKSPEFYVLCFGHKEATLKHVQGMKITHAPFTGSGTMNVATRMKNWLHAIQIFGYITLNTIGIKCVSEVLKKRNKAVEIISKSDLVVFVAGDYISDVYGLIPLFMHFGNLLLAKMYRKKIAFLGHSIGPFRSLLGKIIGFFILRSANGIIVRDERSLSIAKRFSSDHTKVDFLPDFALYALGKKNLADVRTNRSNLKIGIVTSGTIWRLAKNYDLGGEGYSYILECLIDWLTGKLNATVYLLVCSIRPFENDLNVAEQLFVRLQNKDHLSIRTCVRPEDALRVFQELNLLISPRLHPILFALSIAVPVIGIDYNAKIAEAMKMFGLEPYVLNFEKINLNVLRSLVRNVLANEKMIKSVISKHKLTLASSQVYEKRVLSVIGAE